MVYTQHAAHLPLSAAHNLLALLPALQAGHLVLPADVLPEVLLQVLDITLLYTARQLLVLRVLPWTNGGIKMLAALV